MSNKQELRQITFNHSSDIDFKNFVNCYKKYTAKPYYSLIFDPTLASNNPSSFRKKIFRKNIKTNHDN